MKTKTKVKKEKYYLLKLLNKIFNILFYAAVFLIFLSVIVALIVAIVKVDVDHMILPPFMKRGEDSSGAVGNYALHIGNGLKITVEAETITLGDIKAMIYSGLFLLIAILATAAPIIKFFAALMRNIVNGFPDDIKNIYYMYYIGLCLSVGGIIIKFVTRFYNYKLISIFVKDSAAVLQLDLNIDLLYAVPGLLIIFAAFLFNYIRKSKINSAENAVQYGAIEVREEKALAESIPAGEKKNKDDI